MKLIKIIKGTYGYRHAGSKRLDPKNASSTAFEVDDSEAKRLVALGIAVYVKNPSPTAEAKPNANRLANQPHTGAATGTGASNSTDPGDNTSEQESGGSGAGDNDSDCQDERPEYSMQTNINVLRSLMKIAGLQARIGMTKPEMVAALDLHYGVNEDADDTDDEDAGSEDDDGEDIDEDIDGDVDDSGQPQLTAGEPVK